MGTRATHTLASFGLRYLRRQPHAALENQLPPVSSGSLFIFSPASSSSPVDRRSDGGQEELRNLQTKLLDPKASSFGLAQQVSMKDSFGSGKHLQNTSPSQDRSMDELSIDIVNGSRFARGIQHWASETITEGHDEEAACFRDHDFFSRYLQWRSYARSVRSPKSQNYPEAAAHGLLSLTRLNSKTSSPHLLLSSSSLVFQQEPSVIIPLEASSVKRKRKKKMNKHKQRKLRRRDRHRN